MHGLSESCGPFEQLLQGSAEKQSGFETSRQGSQLQLATQKVARPLSTSASYLRSGSGGLKSWNEKVSFNISVCKRSKLRL
mmetsp:Transcript_28692/g.82449  ORF Transcript_28692/g.82449 Transcript_28692/m.82449 type:complete len:81 (-) Transcript_28692:78-320(-)